MKTSLALLLVLLLSMPATADVIRVTHATDDSNVSNGTCNLREAIKSAAVDAAFDACTAGNGVDDIVFDVTGTLTFLQALPDVTNDTNLFGPGADLLTLDLEGQDRVFRYTGGQTVTLSGVTLTGGQAVEGGAIKIINGTLTISDVVITSNTATSSGGGIHGNSASMITVIRSTIADNTAIDFRGGGIYTEGILVVNHSTISNNMGRNGGGIDTCDGDLTVESSTLSGNTATLTGGGINWVNLDNDENSELVIRHSTIVNNSAGEYGGGVYIFQGETVTLINSIFSENTDTSGADYPNMRIFGSVTLATGYNLISDNTGVETQFPAGNPNANNDYAGTAAAPLNAGLDVLKLNGGPTKTHLPTASAANVLDKGSCDLEPYDQRGHAGTPLQRIHDLPAFPNAEFGCDIGAVERDAPKPVMDFDIIVMLDGAYDGTSTMHTDLNDQIPRPHPYNTAPWNHSGTENLTPVPTDVVDWILVSLYKGVPDNSTRVYRGAFGLRTSGRLRKPSDYVAPAVDIGPYYIVVEHRNHLSVMSALPHSVAWFLDTAPYIFKEAQDRAYGTNALRDRGSGHFTMWGGDGDANGSTTAFDFLNEWLPINGSPSGYYAGDFDMNGSGTAFDFLNIWLPANGQASQIP